VEVRPFQPLYSMFRIEKRIIEYKEWEHIESIKT